jgi:hypothetical protein
MRGKEQQEEQQPQREQREQEQGQRESEDGDGSGRAAPARSRKRGLPVDDTREAVARWLSEQSGLRVRWASDAAFVADLRDGIALCVALDNTGWLSAQETERVVISDKRHLMAKAHKRGNVAIARAALARRPEPELVRAAELLPELEGLLPETVTPQVLPSLVALMRAAQSAQREQQEAPQREQQEDARSTGAASSGAESGASQGGSVVRRRNHKMSKRRIKQLVRSELSSGALLGGALAPLEAEEVHRALGSICGLLIFLTIMLLATTLLGDLLGLTDVGFARLLGIRRGAAHSDVSWYTTVKRAW